MTLSTLLALATIALVAGFVAAALFRVWGLLALLVLVAGLMLLLWMAGWQTLGWGTAALVIAAMQMGYLGAVLLPRPARRGRPGIPRLPAEQGDDLR